jgi:hypothetical protein
VVSGDKVEPAIYAADIENCDDCWLTVCLDRQHGAFHGTNPELGLAVFGDARSTLASVFARQTSR